MLQEAIQSPHILSRLQVTKWENRNQIESLIRLLRLMKKQRLSPAEGQLYFLLRHKFPNDYLQLLKETDPIKYRACMEEQEKSNQQKQSELISMSLRQQQWIEEEKREYAFWLSLQK